MSIGHSPLFRRRRLGEQLRELREARGVKLQQLASELGWSHTKLSRLENAKVRPDLADIMDLVEALGATAEQEQRLYALARQAGRRGWWRAYAEMPQRQAGRAELETDAIEIREYGLVLVPGLLQTVDYMRVRFADSEGFPAFDQEVAARGRQERQRILAGERPVRYHAILDEAVLRRRSAPVDVMRDQLRHLIDIQERSNVTVRVLPLNAELACYAGPLNTFTIFQFPDPEDGDLVMVETETSDLQLGDKEDVSRYRGIFERIAAAALPAEATTVLIKSIIEGMEKGGVDL